MVLKAKSFQPLAGAGLAVVKLRPNDFYPSIPDRFDDTMGGAVDPWGRPAPAIEQGPRIALNIPDPAKTDKVPILSPKSVAHHVARHKIRAPLHQMRFCQVFQYHPFTFKVVEIPSTVTGPAVGIVRWSLASRSVQPMMSSSRSPLNSCTAES